MVSCEQGNLIKLSLINERVMTFSAEDYLRLRKDYRIMGKLIGVAPPFPKNVDLAHLPAIFAEYETKLMLEEKIAVLEEKLHLGKRPTDQMREEYEEHQRQVTSDILKPCIESKLETVKANMESIIKGKRKKLIKSGVAEEEINITEEDVLREEEDKVRRSMSVKNVPSQIPTQYPFESAVRVISEYPVKNEARYRVFKDLWHKGLFITSATSFGGDFLAYSSDPKLLHASQIVHIIDRNHEFELSFLSNCARVALTVKKACVFAYLDEHDSVVYQTLSWRGEPNLRELYSTAATTLDTQNDTDSSFCGTDDDGDGEENKGETSSK